MKLENNLYKLVYEYNTKYKEGFMPNEIQELLDLFPDINMKYYNDAMMGNTCTMHEGKFCMYHCDVYKALQVGLEERDLKVGEWD